MQLDKGVGSLGVDSNRRSLWVVKVLFCKLDGDNNRRSILVFWGTGSVLFDGSVEGGQMDQ
jgi:hypothetical protein